MIKIAIAGGIGSGKSMVSAFLRKAGAKVIVADEINQRIMSRPDYVRQISCIFPTVVHNNVINKKELASLVFSDEAARQKLMSVSHPAIYHEMEVESQGATVVFYEIPLLSECPVRFDFVWYVDAPKECRARRVISRDGKTFDEAMRIIELQFAEEKFKETADVLLDNSAGLDALEMQVKAAYCSILSNFS